MSIAHLAAASADSMDEFTSNQKLGKIHKHPSFLKFNMARERILSDF